MSCHCWANVMIQYNCGPTLQSLWANLGYQLTNLRPSLHSWAKVVPMPLWCLGYQIHDKFALLPLLNDSISKTNIPISLQSE